MKIIYKLANSSNYAKRTNKKNEWIVLHYTGNNNDTAKGNANYFSNPVTPVRSANYFVDEKEIYCSVNPVDAAYGASSSKYYCAARNANSIHIEMCDSVINIPEKAKQNVFWLVKYLMDKYNIDDEHIIRHYDITHKKCPLTLVDNNAWIKFKYELKNYIKNGGKIMNVEEAKQKIKTKCGLSDWTIEWLSCYKFSDDLFIKIAENLK